MAAEFNALPEMAAMLQETARKIVVKTCFDIQALAQQNAPVDTGFLKSSIYTVTADGSTYGQDASGPLLPEVDKPTDDTTGFIAVAAEYGLYVEMGTSRAPAQPYLVPAAEIVRPAFEAAFAALEAKLRLAGGL